MSDFTLLVKSSPYTTNNHQTALDFAHALIRAGHRLCRVFFYQDAVFVALNSQQPVQGQETVCGQWQSLSQQTGTELQVCIANALRRGIADTREQQRYNLPAATLASGFVLTGLGEMADACHDSQHIVEF